MSEKFRLAPHALFLAAVLVVVLYGAAVLFSDSRPAFGGGFAPQVAPPGPRYQIAGGDGNSAWIIDTGTGDVYLMYASGRWKEVGSIQDERKQIKK